MNNICKECRQLLGPNEIACSCGCKMQIMKNDYQCQYRVNNEMRCKKAGNVTLQVRGNCWYCSEHIHQVMRDIEKKHHEILTNQLNGGSCHE